MDYSYSLLLISLTLLVSIYFLFVKNSSKRSDIKPYPILGHLPQFLGNRHRSHEWMTSLLAATPSGTLVFRRPGNIRGVITANPANVEHLLRSNFPNFPKGPRVLSTLHDFLGNGIFNSDGDQWRSQRKTASYEFNTRSLRNFVLHNVHLETSTRLLPLLHKCADDNKLVIDIQDVLERYAFDNVCKISFNADPACLSSSSADVSSAFADAFRDAASLSAGRFRYAVPWLWKIKKMLNIGSENRLQASIAAVHDFALQIIRSRMRSNPPAAAADDLLSRFIATGEYDEGFLRDIVISFLLAGRETTSSALTWFFWIVSSRPDVQQRILDEVATVRAARTSGSAADQMFEFDELRDMQYLHAAITESMRLYPPVPTNVTLCEHDDVLPDGTEIKKGWFASYQQYAMARMEGVWGKDCREYRPERWLDDEGMFRPESPFKFLAFHAGPRMCLGKEMAYIQMKSVAACVLERFEIEVLEKGKIPQQMLSLTLRMKGGLPVRVRNRRPTV